MAVYQNQYPCLHNLNWAHVYNESTETVSIDANLAAQAAVLSPEELTLKKRRLAPTLKRGVVSPIDLPYVPGTAFQRSALCPEVITNLKFLTTSFLIY